MKTAKEAISKMYREYYEEKLFLILAQGSEVTANELDNIKGAFSHIEMGVIQVCRESEDFKNKTWILKLSYQVSGFTFMTHRIEAVSFLAQLSLLEHVYNSNFVITQNGINALSEIRRRGW